MIKIILFLISVISIYASQPMPNKSLTLTQALEKLNKQNLEIKASALDVKSAQAKKNTASGNHWGKLDLIQDIVNSDDAGNVFGFKVTSKEATFGDFGFSEFDGTNPNILNVAPKDLNYPEARTLYQTKLKYEVPLFAGFQISSYSEILNLMIKMKSLDKDKVVNEKRYQLKKSYYDMSLLDSSISNLSTVLKNIETLENTTQNMIDVGYAKKVDLLEVKAKKGNVERLVSQMKYNKKLLYQYISFLLNEKVTLIDTPEVNIEIPTVSDENILNNNIDIQRADIGYKITDNMANVSESAFYPMVGAFAEVATSDDTFLGEANNHKSYTIGARLQWNLFNGGVDYNKVQEAKIQKLKVHSQTQLARHGIKLKIAKLRTEIETQDSEIESLKKELKLADAIYENYEGRYKEKLSSMSDVIIKQSEQIQKILQLQQAQNKRNERIFALIKLANGDR